MRKTSISMIYELAKRDPRVVFIGSDLAPGILQEMRDEFPERFFMEGVSEQNIIGMAAGLAMNGYIPYINTIATFLTRRCYEQIALDLCLQKLPVRLIGSGGGFVYTPLGPTHLAIEDFAILRALPNMAVTAVCDADEMRRLMDVSLDWPAPLYIRLAKGGDTVVSLAERGFAIGKAITMREPQAAHPAVIFSTGVCTQRALAAADLLAEEDHPVRVVHLHTVKPLDTEHILAAVRDAAGVVTVEEHTLCGGLGSAILETLADNGVLGVPVTRLGIPDVFPAHYGGQDDLMHTFGLQPPHIVAAVKNILAGHSSHARASSPAAAAY